MTQSECFTLKAVKQTPEAWEDAWGRWPLAHLKWNPGCKRKLAFEFIEIMPRLQVYWKREIYQLIIIIDLSAGLDT